jgi:hypothetical protein
MNCVDKITVVWASAFKCISLLVMNYSSSQVMSRVEFIIYGFRRKPAAKGK